MCVCFTFFRFIEGREIRCAVVESVRTGQLKALSCLEYNIRHNDIRKTEDKYMLNEMGLPLGTYWTLQCISDKYLSTILQNFIHKPMQISEARWKISARFGSNQRSGSWTKLTFLGLAHAS